MYTVSAVSTTFVWLVVVLQYLVFIQANSHERYARAFVQQRVREVFEILDSKVRRMRVCAAAVPVT